MISKKKTMWELLWDFDPNGLIVMNLEWRMTLANAAFCKMFRTTPEEIVGREAESILGDISDFRHVWETNEVIRGKQRAYPEFNLYLKQVIFPIRDEQIVAGIMVDFTHELKQKDEMLKIRRETIEKVTRVVDHQMKVAQEIAGLLGETTAETKVSLLKLIQMVEQETL